MRILPFILVLLFSVPLAYAAETDIDKAPQFFLQGTVGNNSAISMECTGNPPFNKIDCRFTQLLIMSAAADRIAKEKKEFEAEVEQMKPGDMDKFLAPFKELNSNTLKKNLTDATPEQKAFFADFQKIMKKLTNSATKDDIKKIMSEVMSMQHSTCKILQKSFTQSFERVHKNKWLSNPGPDGLCNVVRVSTLENEPEHPILWTYTSTIASVDKNDVCNKWVDAKHKIVSSWKTPKAYKFSQCKYLTYE